MNQNFAAVQLFNAPPENNALDDVSPPFVDAHPAFTKT